MGGNKKHFLLALAALAILSYVFGSSLRVAAFNKSHTLGEIKQSTCQNNMRG